MSTTVRTSFPRPPRGTSPQRLHRRPRGLLGAAFTAVTAVGVLMAALVASPAQGAVPAPAGWSLQWSDDFNGSANTLPSTSDWIIDTGHAYSGGPANWGTGEVQSYTNSTSNLALDGSGNLKITPIKDSAGNWTSGRIETQRADFKPAAGSTLRIEGRIQMPNVTGTAAIGYWPAFWALGAPYRGNYQNWPGIGEYDVMENVNGINKVWGTLHCGTNPGGPCNETTGLGNSLACPGSACQSAFHTYTFEWDRSVSPNVLRWYVDGTQFHSVSQSAVDAATWSSMTDHAGYFILLNVAIGGAFPDAIQGSTTPTSATESGHPMLVDYVAVWTKSGTGTSTATATATATSGTSSSQYLLSGGSLGSAASSASTVTLASAGGANHDGTPYQQQTFTRTGVTGTYTGGSTAFDLYVDAGTTVANGQQVRVSYDLTGNGSYDRTETYNYFATDPVTGYEHYTQAKGLQAATGSLGNLSNGTVRVEVWNAIGNGTSTLGAGNQSVVTIPYS